MGSMITLQTDCLILGGGLAGWMAARETAAAGLKTMLLHDGMGASPWVHGFNVPVYPEDSADIFLQDTLASGQGLSDPALARALCQDAAEVFDEIRAMGLSFNREKDGSYQALRPLGASWPRVVSIGNETGAAILTRLKEMLKGSVTELPATRALKLLKDGSRVCGTLAYDAAGKRWLNLRANAVVLACGGYCGIYPVSTNKRDSGGDGVAMAYEAGAELCDMEFIQFEPSAAVWPRELVGTSVITTLLFEGAVLRNRDGERFMLRYGPEGDRVSKDVMSRRIVAEIARGKGTEHGGIYMDITGVDPARLASGYQMYVQRYRNVGIDITKEWIELAPAPHTALGGVRVDAQGHSTVQGLFACGEVMGGLHGANRIGGNAGLETLVFGRRAGRAAAAFARSAGPCNAEPESAPQLAEESCSSKIAALRRGMREALWDGVNAVRDAQGLQKAINVFSDGLEAVSALRGVDAQESFELLRLKNDMIAAHLTALSALTRADSLGCHARSDYPQEAKHTYRVMARMDENARPYVWKEDLES